MLWLGWHLWHTSSTWHTWLLWHWWLSHWCLWHSVLLLHTMWSWHTSLISTHLLLVLHVVMLSWTSVIVVSVILVWSSTLTSSVLSILLHTETSLGLLVMLHDFNKLLENLSHMWMSDEIVQVESSCLLCHVFLIIRLIDSFFSLEFSKLLDLIMVNDKRFSFNSVIVEVLFC